MAEYLAAPAEHVTRIPTGLKSELVAPLLWGKFGVVDFLMQSRINRPTAGLAMYTAVAKS